MPSMRVRVEDGPNSMWNDYMESWWSGDLKEFVRSYFSLNSTVVQVYRYILSDSSLEYHLVYRKPQPRYLQFWNEARTKRLSQTTSSLSLNIDARSVARALSGLLEWFDMEAPDGNSTDLIVGGNATSPVKSWDPCMRCVDSLQRCMENALCREAAVYDMVPNWLTPSMAYDNSRLSFWGRFSDSISTYYSYIYSGEIS